MVGLAVVAVVVAGGTLADPGEKDQGYLGVYMQKLTRDVREGLEIDVKKGVLISGVEEDSPADEAGLEDGDVIVEFDGKTVRSPDNLRDMVRETEPGTEVEIVVVRDGDRKTIELTVGELPDQWTVHEWSDDAHGEHWNWIGDNGRHAYAMLLGGPKLGVHATEMGDDLAAYFDTEGGEGILVLEVVEESVAEEAGVVPGDVILKVDDSDISEVDDLRASLKDFEEGDEFEVSIIRKGKTRTLTATMDDQSNKFVWSGTAPRVREKLKGLHVPDIRVHVDRDEIDETLDELREEIKKLKKEIKKLKDDR
jgi:S1-C subfamily serine protease